MDRSIIAVLAIGAIIGLLIVAGFGFGVLGLPGPGPGTPSTPVSSRTTTPPVLSPPATVTVTSYPAATSPPGIPGPAEETPVPTQTYTGPPDFALDVVPLDASGRAGEMIMYQMTILPVNGFSAPVHLTVDASALVFFTEHYDLGTVEPPYPLTIHYPFTIPSRIPGGTAVTGVVHAAGGGIERDVGLELTVR
jgi:hypothetical protein